MVRHISLLRIADLSAGGGLTQILAKGPFPDGNRTTTTVKTSKVFSSFADIRSRLRIGRANRGSRVRVWLNMKRLRERGRRYYQFSLKNIPKGETDAGIKEGFF